MAGTIKTTYKYALTVTLKPNLYRYKAEQQYDTTYIKLIDKLNILSSSKKLVVAELTNSANIHYHCMLIFPLGIAKCYQKYIIDGFRNMKEFGFVCVKQITDEQGWIEYLTKNLKETQMAIQRPPIIIDEENLLKYNNIFASNMVRSDIINEQ